MRDNCLDHHWSSLNHLIALILHALTGELKFFSSWLLTLLLAWPALLHKNVACQATVKRAAYKIRLFTDNLEKNLACSCVIFHIKNLSPCLLLTVLWKHHFPFQMERKIYWCLGVENLAWLLFSRSFLLKIIDPWFGLILSMPLAVFSWPHRSMTGILSPTDWLSMDNQIVQSNKSFKKHKQSKVWWFTSSFSSDIEMPDHCFLILQCINVKQCHKK